MNIVKWEEVCVPKMPKYNKLLQILHIYYKLRDTYTSLQPIFRIVQSLVLTTFLQRLLGIDGAKFWEMERGLSQ